MALDQLHWLPIKERIKYKLALFAFKAIHCLAPDYISDLVSSYTVNRSLRRGESNQLLLTIPKSRLVKIGVRPFRVAGPRAWNELPTYLIAITKRYDFKKRLKTHF